MLQLRCDDPHHLQLSTGQRRSFTQDDRSLLEGLARGYHEAWRARRHEALVQVGIELFSWLDDGCGWGRLLCQQSHHTVLEIVAPPEERALLQAP
ncbi:MAG: hypothetical protein KTR31_21865 [Myxococcales bacterium]|nr:hypothetical protein [Myxococcales bacterium]